MTVLRMIGDVLLVAGWTLPAVLAPIFYHDVRRPDGGRGAWRRSRLGQLLMAHMATLAVLAVLGTLRVLFGDGTVWAALRVVAYVALVAVTWWWLWVVLAERRASVEDAGPLAPK